MVNKKMEKEKIIHKCYFDLEGKYNPCAAMNKKVNWLNDKGIYCPEIINFTTSLVRRIGVSYKLKKKEKGIWFNVCPFCGEHILNDKQQLNTDKVPYYNKQ